MNTSLLAWRFPCTEEPGGRRPMGWQRVGQDLAQGHYCIYHIYYIYYIILYHITLAPSPVLIRAVQVKDNVEGIHVKALTRSRTCAKTLTKSWLFPFFPEIRNKSALVIHLVCEAERSLTHTEDRTYVTCIHPCALSIPN